MKATIRVEPVALLPTQIGCALFLSDSKKVVVIYIDPAVGMAINSALAGETPTRPLTHDLITHIFTAFGAKVARVIIHSVEDEIYYARLIIEASNELTERKIVEIDARPSDCIALAVRMNAPILFTEPLWQSLEDRSQLLASMRDHEEPPNLIL